MRVLLKFPHGLGDAVQFTIVLRHLQKYKPDWEVDVWSFYGKHSALRGLCTHAYSDRDPPLKEDAYDKVIHIDWSECGRSFDSVPSTKAALCLAEVFQIAPDPELFFYSVEPSAAATHAAHEYVREITGQPAADNGRWPVVFIHYQGNTAVEQKNLSHSVVALLCQVICNAGLTPVILDWDGRSPLVNNKTVFCPNVDHAMWCRQGTGDAGIIAALISSGQLFIGIDSGPLHVAGATTTPSVGVWTGHSPIRYFDRADNVTHLVPGNWQAAMTVEQATVFERYYKYCARSTPNLAADIGTLASNLLGVQLPPMANNGLISVRGFMIRQNNVNQDLTIVDDVYWRDCYKTAIIPQVVENAAVVVDIGAHIGTFAKLVHEKNPTAKIICVEACPENIEALRANVGAFAEIVHAACSYEDGELALCNAVRPDCVSTGGSIVVPAADVMAHAQGPYWPDTRPLPKVTLEQLGAQFGFDKIDLLKLDCEASEFSILGGCDIARVRFILGEYHGRERWDKFRQVRFADWDYGHMSMAGDMGNFHLRNTAAATVEVLPDQKKSL